MSLVAPLAVVDGVRAQGRRNKTAAASHHGNHDVAVGAFGLIFAGWEAEKGRMPPNSSMSCGERSAPHDVDELGADSSPEIDQSGKTWRNSGGSVERHRRPKSASERGGSLERSFPRQIPTSADSRL